MDHPHEIKIFAVMLSLILLVVFCCYFFFGNTGAANGTEAKQNKVESSPVQKKVQENTKTINGEGQLTIALKW